MDPRTDSAPDRTDLREVLRPILTRWPIVLGLALVIGAGGYYQEHKKTVTYISQTQILIQSTSQVEDLVLGGSGQWSDPTRVSTNQAILLKTRSVAARVAKKLRSRVPPEVLLGAISVDSAQNSDFLTLQASAGDPASAAAIANGFAQAYVESRSDQFRAEAKSAQKTAERQLAQLVQSGAPANQRRDLQRKIQRLDLLQSFPVKDAKQIDRALPGAGVGPKPVRMAVFGFFLGLLLGAGIAYLLELLDRRVTRSTELEPLYDSRVLVEVPFVRNPLDTVDGVAAMPEDFEESFRSLRTILQLEHGAPRSLVVVSAVPGEGKSTIVRNIAIAYREEGLRVAAIDADLRKPDLARLFMVSGEPGLMDVLTGAVDLEEALQDVPVHAEGLDTMARLRHMADGGHGPGPAYESRVQPVEEPHFGRGMLRRRPPAEIAPPTSQAPAVEAPYPNGNGGNGHAPDKPPGGFSLLGAGARPANPASVLSSPRFRTVLNEITSTHDMVVIDSPPVLSVSDAVPLLTAADGVIVATRLSLTTQDAARQLAEAIRRVPGVNVLGVVANAGDEPRGYYPSTQSGRRAARSIG
jgi:Mrp family chromosome partitioning ATPase/capsular polysaccharide biosynthesis protein